MFIDRTSTRPYERAIRTQKLLQAKTLTIRGIRDTYVMVWLCMTTREVIASEATLHPDSAWIAKQGDLFVDRTASRDEKPDIVMHDKDAKFTKEFTAKLKERGLRTNSLPKASPNLNGRCERIIGTIKWECLSRFIVFGKRHLDYLLSEFVEYYNTTRSSMVRDHLPPIREEPNEVASLRLDEVEITSHVGGLVKSFARKAA